MKNIKLFGFTLVEIMIVVAIIGLLAAIAIPNFVHSQQVARQNACINNLRQIDGAKQEWSMEKRKTSADVPQPSDLQPYLGRTAAGELPTCPADPADSFATSYNPNAVAVAPTCNILPASHVLP